MVAATAGIVAPLGHRLAGLLLAARPDRARRPDHGCAPAGVCGLGTGLIAAASGMTLREVLLTGVAAIGGMARLT